MERKDHKLVLKDNGLKNTKSRAAVLGVLETCKQPVSAEQIFLEIRKNEPASPISIATVYRNLDTLVKKGIAAKVNMPGGSKSLYELECGSHRHYIVCLGCSRMLPVSTCPFNGYEEAVAKETGFLIEGHRLDIYGYCPKCRASRLLNNE